MTLLVTNHRDIARGGRSSKRLGTHRRLDLWPPQWQKRPAVLYIKPRGSKEEQGGGVRRPGGRHHTDGVRCCYTVSSHRLHQLTTAANLTLFFCFLDQSNPFRLRSFISVCWIRSWHQHYFTTRLFSNLQTENHKLKVWHWIQQHTTNPNPSQFNTFTCGTN